MSFLAKQRRPNSDDVRRVALAALAAALDDGKRDDTPKRSGLKGVRALVAGAALYTAGRAAYRGRHEILERLGYAEEYDDDEPEAEADEEFDEDDDPEAAAEEDDDFEDEDEDVEDEEPEAAADEDDDFEEEPEATEEDADEEDVEDGGGPTDGAEEDLDEDDERRESAASRPPVRSDRGSGDEQDLELPDPPSRPRAPVGRS